MESNEVREQLREVERGEAAAWVTYPTTPRWWPFAFGAWSFAYAGVVGWLSDLPRAGAMLLLVAMMLGLVAWVRRRRGAWPTGPAPREIKRTMTWLFAGAAVVAGTAWLVGETLGVLPAAVLAGVGVTALVAHYERAYARAANEVRERLG